MIFRRDLSLRWKIPLRVMAAVLGTAAVVTAALMAWEYDEMRQSLEGHAKSLGRVLANTLVVPVIHDDVWRAYEILQSARESFPSAPEMQAEIVLVTDAAQKVFVSTKPREFPIGSSPASKGGPFAQLGERLRSGDSTSQEILEPGDSPVYFVISPLVADGIALGHVVLGYSKVSFFPRFVGLASRAALVTLVVLAIIAPFSWIWASATGEPLLRLAEAMRRVPEALEDTRLEDLPKTRDEIGQLAQSFRRMVGELKKKEELEGQMLVSERLAAVGRLTAGIAHEINNPLAGMITAINTYQKHGEKTDPLAMSTLSLLERGLTQIRHTVSALLVETKPQDRPFTLEDVKDVLILVEAETHRKEMQVSVQDELSGPLPLPAALVRQILLNLLLNAVTAVEKGGKVLLVLSMAENRLKLMVRNDGGYIPQERMQTLFEPFTTTSESGHGLGLWIVYQIVQQLGGDIEVESLPGNTEFRLQIPYGQYL
jgi:two-component system, NtrC family, sensor kinase